jgi:hypothetical protein
MPETLREWSISVPGVDRCPHSVFLACMGLVRRTTASPMMSASIG